MLLSLLLSWLPVCFLHHCDLHLVSSLFAFPQSEQNSLLEQRERAFTSRGRLCLIPFPQKLCNWVHLNVSRIYSIVVNNSQIGLCHQYSLTYLWQDYSKPTYNSYIERIGVDDLTGDLDAVYDHFDWVQLVHEQDWLLLWDFSSKWNSNSGQGYYSKLKVQPQKYFCFLELYIYIYDLIVDLDAEYDHLN